MTITIRNTHNKHFTEIEYCGEVGSALLGGPSAPPLEPPLPARPSGGLRPPNAPGGDTPQATESRWELLDS